MAITLNPNKIYASLSNMIISQDVEANNINGTNSDLVNMARVDASLYGDTKQYIFTDALATQEWLGDAEASNLLKLHRPKDPVVQTITLDKFRMVPLTTDEFLTKQAYAKEGAFSSFNSTIKGWLNDTKKIFDAANYNTFIGCEVAKKAGKQNITLELPVNDDPEKQARLQAQFIAKEIGNLMVELTDFSRDFNDSSLLRSYSKDDLMIIWNSKVANEITFMDLPTIYHKENLFDKQYTLPSRYFGKVNDMAGDTTGSNTTVRAYVEKDYGKVHCFPGDLLPNSTHYEAGETYTEDANVLCKIIAKKSVPYFSNAEVSTSFYNPRSLTETNFLIFGRNTLEHIVDRPFITVKKA